MKAFFKIAIACLVYFPSYAQWSDDFTDGDFTANPEWVGNTGDFIVDTEVLRLNAPAVSATSYISTMSDISLEAQWNFWVKLDFNPSSSNFIIVYLMADTQNLTSVSNGYFVKMGGTADEVSLYKVSDGSETLLIDGLDGRLNLSSVELNIEVTRDATGVWEVKDKLLGEMSITSEGTATDIEIQESAYFGVQCTYTSTRSTKMYIDDISVSGSPYVDQDAPELLSFATPSANQIQLLFNEPMDPVESESTANYELNVNMQPNSATLINGNTVLLEFTNDLNIANTLGISGVPDITGNELDTLIEVIFVDPSPHMYGEVIVNELLPDPSPREDLPEFEFVELSNQSGRIIDLTDWIFTDGSSEAKLPQQLLFPDSLLIICPMDAAPLYSVYGTTLGLSAWPTLNNGGDNLWLIDNHATVIDSVHYTLEWYNNPEKDDGGWSLEQINPTSQCEGKYNWAASLDISGGTPGEPNSWLEANKDMEAPQITGALWEKDSIRIWLSGPTIQGNYEALILPNQTTIDITISEPGKYLVTPFPQGLDLETTYTVELMTEDCSGNAAVSASTLIPVAEPQTGDIIINELLFDPYTGGSDFVELLNTTPYYFNLEGFGVANETTKEYLSDSILLFKPYRYIVISEDILFLKNQYLAPDSSLFETDLPTMPNDEGIIVIKNDLGITLDSVFYSEDYHFTLLDNAEGVSLERVSPMEDSGNPDNWKSAAETVGFATPGYANSQTAEVTSEGKVTVDPQVITPNNDGQSDYCQIKFELTGSDKVISVNIYNLNGQLIKTLANNVLISPQGFFTWDGTDEQGSPLPTAHYIIVSEVVGSDGRTQRFRNKVVVANGF